MLYRPPASFAALFVCLLCLASAASSQAQDKPAPPAAPSADRRDAAETAFKNANAALESKHYAAALAEYDKVLALLPDDESVLWNSGLAAYFSSDYAAAAKHWGHLRGLVPMRGTSAGALTVALISAKLIQAYQEEGDIAARDRERAALVKLRAAGTDPALAKLNSFCCDQFTVGDRQVFAYDYFALTGKFAFRYDFVVAKPDGTTDYHVALECDADDNTLSRQMGEIKPNERLFSMDGYYDSGRTHKTFGFLKAKAAKPITDPKSTEPSPPYNGVRTLAIRCMKGEVKPVSGFSTGGAAGTGKAE